MADDRIVIEIELDDGSIVKGFQKVEKKAKKSGKSLNTIFKQSFRLITKEVLAFSGAFIAAFAAREILDAAAKQEESVNNLDTALRLAGDSVEDLSKDIQDFAANIESTTKISDELVLEQFALARSFTNTAEEAKKLIKSAIDLNAATGGAITLDSAVKNLGRTFGGLTGELGEVLPQLRNFTQEELKAGKALDFVAQRFGGAAEAQVTTFSGAVTQVSNSFGTLLENIGLIIIRNPVVINAINDLSKSISGLAKSLQEAFPKAFSSEVDRIKARIKDLKEENESFKKDAADTSQLNKALEESGLSFEGLGKAAKGIVKDFFEFRKRGTEGVNKALKANNEEIARLTERLSILGRQEALGKLSRDAAALANAQRELQLVAETTDFEANLAKEEEALRKRLDILVNSLSMELITEARFQELSLQQARAFEIKKEQLRLKFASDAELQAQQLGVSLRKQIGTGIGTAVERMTQALTKGENAFEAFGGAVLGFIGDMAVSTGKTLISIGIGMEAVKNSILGLTGGPAIFAGIALVALGTLLKSLSGGGGEASAAGGGGTTAPTGGVDDTAFTEPEEVETKPTTSVNVEIQGSIFDSEETGSRIVSIINESFDTEGTRVVAT